MTLFAAAEAYPDETSATEASAQATPTNCSRDNRSRSTNAASRTVVTGYREATHRCDRHRPALEGEQQRHGCCDFEQGDQQHRTGAGAGPGEGPAYENGGQERTSTTIDALRWIVMGQRPASSEIARERDVEHPEEETAQSASAMTPVDADLRLRVLLGRCQRYDRNGDDRDHQSDDRHRSWPLTENEAVDDRDDRAGDGRNRGDDADEPAAHSHVEPAESCGHRRPRHSRPQHVSPCDLLRAGYASPRRA